MMKDKIIAKLREMEVVELPDGEYWEGAKMGWVEALRWVLRAIEQECDV